VTQKYLVEYKVWSAPDASDPFPFQHAIYQYIFSKHSDPEKNIQLVREELNKDDILIGVWQVEWNNPNSDHKLVYGTNQPANPGTHVRKGLVGSKKNKETKKELVVIEKHSKKHTTETKPVTNPDWDKPAWVLVAPAISVEEFTRSKNG
jgi:hypothetical protein